MATPTTTDKVVEWSLIIGAVILVIAIIAIAILLAKHHSETVG